MLTFEIEYCFKKSIMDDEELKQHIGKVFVKLKEVKSVTLG